MEDNQIETVKFPAHKCGLHLSHNEHKDYYETIKDYIESRDLADDFASPEAMQKAIDADSIWELQWYPDTPVGFVRVAASTFDEVLRFANQ